MRKLRRRLLQDEGAALVLVLIVLLLLATLAAEIATTARTHYRVADHAMNDLLLRTAVDGRREILKKALLYDASLGDNLDKDDDDWSRYNMEKLSKWGENPEATGPGYEEQEGSIVFRNTEIELEAWCVDERSKLNLRGLAKPEETDVHRYTREALVRLIDIYREPWKDLDLTESDADEMVDALLDFLTDEDEDEDNPIPNVKPNRGRLQSIDDLLRVPEGHWSAERLYDVRDPEWDEDEDRRDEDEDLEEEDDARFEQSNGVPGLARYLSVYAESDPDPVLRINFNTASEVVIKCLFEDRDSSTAEEVVAYRRQAAGQDDEEDGGGPPSEDDPGYFRSKADLAKVDGMGDDLADYPRVNFFFDTRSNVFSLHVIGKMVATQIEGEEYDDEEDQGPKEILATYQYREVVQRSNRGFQTLYVERRRDPYYDR